MDYGLSFQVSQAWRLPDAGFTQAHMRAAATVVDELTGDGERPELAFLSGDRAQGLGLVNSAVDLYLVGPATARGTTVHEVDGTRLRVRTMSPARVTELLALTTRYRARAVASPQLAMGIADIRDMLRLTAGHRLAVAPRWADELHAVSQDAIRQILVSRNALAFAACAADVFDSLLFGDLFTAVTMSAAAVHAGCEAALAAIGDVGLGAKFVFRRLARSSVTAPWCEYVWQLLHRPFLLDGVPSPTQVHALVEERLLAANQLLACCAIDGWEKPLAALPEPAPRRAAADGGGGGSRRSAYFTPVRFVDAWTLLGPGAGYEVNEDVVRLWRRLDGGHAADFASDPTTSEWEAACRSGVDVESIVDTLHELGAVEPSTGRADRTSLAAAAETIRASVRFDPAARSGWVLDLTS